MTLLQIMGIFLTKGTSRKCKDNLERKSSSQVHATICTGGAVTVHLKPTYVKHCVEKQFWEVYHAGVQFQWKKNQLQTTLRWEYLDFSCHSTKPTQETWKPQFWPADFTFPSMAAALYLCPKLVNLSRSGYLHVNGTITCNLLNKKKLRIIVRHKKGRLSASKQICWQC